MRFFRNFGWRRRGPLIILLIVGSILENCVNAIAQTKFEMVRSAYLEAAFGLSSNAIVKFKNGHKLLLKVLCHGESVNCKKIPKLISASIEQNSNLKLEFVPSGDANLEFIFADTKYLWSEKAKSDIEFSGGRIDVQDIDCQLFMKLSAAEIEKTRVIISNDITPDKAQKCLSTQFFVGIGLHLLGDANFSSIWEEGKNKFKEMPGYQFEKLKHDYGLLELIQMCPAIPSGMARPEVEKILNRSSACIANIGGI